MTDAATLDAARIAQVTQLRDYLAAALPMITAIRDSEIDGFQLWMGGLPSALIQAESQLTFLTQTITNNFRLAA